MSTNTKGSGAANAFDKYNTPKTGIAAGLAKGHKVTKRAVDAAPVAVPCASLNVWPLPRLFPLITGLAPYEKHSGCIEGWHW